MFKQGEDSLKSKNNDYEKLYKGIHDYIDHKVGFKIKHTISREKVGGALGPLRDYAHIRSSKRFDYQLNICNV